MPLGGALGQVLTKTSAADYATNWQTPAAGGSMTAAQILAALITVDGVGSGLDADLLDGQSSAAFATAVHTHAQSDITGLPAALTAKLDASAYTAADVLTKIKTVDGAGSGLDADLLDGQSSAAFATAAHTHAQSDITNLVADLAAKLPTASYTAADVLTKIKTVDGAGSGLDADLLDGQSSAAFATAAEIAAPPVVPYASGALGTADWNSITTPGWHTQLMDIGRANAPTTTGYYHCLVVAFLGNITQIAIPYSLDASLAQSIWYRGFFGPSTWNPWRQLAVSGYEIGKVAWFAMSTAPTGYLKANGAGLAPGTYPALFAAIGYTHGGSGGTFNLPDLRGEFVRGFDDGRGADSGRVFGSAQNAMVGPHSHDVTAYLSSGGSSSGVVRISGTGATGAAFPTGNGTGTETRPRNVALLACIKYQ